MEQHVACPNCQQVLSIGSSAKIQQVQCPHCQQVFAVAASKVGPATNKSARKRGSKASAHPANMKYVVAGVIMAAMAVLPVAGYGVFRLFASPAKPTLVATQSPNGDGHAGQTEPVVLTGNVIHNDPRGTKPAETASERPQPAGSTAPTVTNSPSGSVARAPVQPSPPTAPSPAAMPAQFPAAKPSGAVASTAADSTPTPTAAAGDTTSLVRQVEPSVVVIQVTREKGSGIGSGFPLDDKGTIVTNYHVIEGAKSIKIKFGDKTADVPGFLVFSPGKDIAVLKANLGPEKLSPLKLATAKPVKGETVFTFGAPLGFDSTVSNGIVSSVRKGTDLREIFKTMFKSDIYVDEQHYDLDAVWVQTTAPISGGNSGGPLVNVKGEVIGLNTWHLVSGQNMNFAISADHITEMMRSATSGVHPFAELPKPREESVAAGNGKRTLEYWEEVSRINRGLATRLKKMKQPAIPNTKEKLLALFPKLAGIYKKLGEMLPETASKLKGLKIDDVDGELVALVTVDAMTLEKIGEATREMALDAKMLRTQKLALYDPETLGKKAFGKFEELELGQAYDVMRIKLTNRYGLTFANLFDAARSKSSDKSDDEDDMADDKDDNPETVAGADPQREKQAAGKLKFAKQLKDAKKVDAAKERLRQVVKDYEGTEAAAEAQKLLDELGDE